jgi:hypothetical protein
MSSRGVGFGGQASREESGEGRDQVDRHDDGAHEHQSHGGQRGGQTGRMSRRSTALPVRRIPGSRSSSMSETSVSTSEPGVQGVAQSGVGAISDPGDVPVKADYQGGGGAD